ncbi:1606_t:CDS:2, partial [Cetraspora pellucida]
RHVYLIDPKTGTYKEYNTEDWSSTISGALIPSTHKIYVTTTFNNLWEISLADNNVRKISWDSWGGCNTLVTVPDDPSECSFKLFAFCHKLWLVDDPNTGHCTDFLGGYTDIWAKVNAATAVGQKIYATTVANNLWCVDTITKETKKLGGGSDNWSNCKALANVGGKLLAFCYGLWEVNTNNGDYTPFFDKDSEEAKRSWLGVKAVTVIDTCVYVVAGDQLLALDTVSKKVREFRIGLNLVVFNESLIYVELDVQSKDA